MKFALVIALSVGALHAQNLTAATQRYFNSVRRNLESSADVMPAEKFSYRLTDGQMTFGEWLIHSAQRNYADCAILKSETAPTVAGLKTKDEITKALKDSFAFAEKATETMTTENAFEEIAKIDGTNTRASITAFSLAHTNDHYGQMVVYLRMNGIVPPASRK